MKSDPEIPLDKMLEEGLAKPSWKVAIKNIFFWLANAVLFGLLAKLSSRR